MENNHKSVIIGIGKDIFIQSHGFLLVATEKINLNAFYPCVLKPFHFLFAGNGGIHFVEWCWKSIIKRAVGVVP